MAVDEDPLALAVSASRFPGSALCLSAGGYRAMALHVGLRSYLDSPADPGGLPYSDHPLSDN